MTEEGSKEKKENCGGLEQNVAPVGTEQSR